MSRRHLGEDTRERIDGEDEAAEFLLDVEGGTDSEVESEDLTPQRPHLSSVIETLKAHLRGRGSGEEGVGVSRDDGASEYRLYPWRWFMLLSICMLNISNGMVRDYR